MILAIDFDGTIVDDRYPLIGQLKPGAEEVLKKLRKDGYYLILWTCRTGIELAQAVKFCAELGVRFDAVNANTPLNIKQHRGDTRKVYANMYIDDRGTDTLPPWPELYHLIHERVPTYEDRVAREGYL